MNRLAPALLGLLCLSAQGCLTVADDEGPILSIELFWDVKTDSDAFQGGTCRSADVDWMEWKLVRTDDGSNDVVVERRQEPCAKGIDVLEPDRGEYTLEITGHSKDNETIWDVECTGLKVLRFDVAYECDIPSP